MKYDVIWCVVGASVEVGGETTSPVSDLVTQSRRAADIIVNYRRWTRRNTSSLMILRVYNNYGAN